MTTRPYGVEQDDPTIIDGIKEFGANLLPKSFYTVFLIILNLFTLSLCFMDAKGIPLLILSLAFSVSVRIGLTRRAEQRRTNELLEELLSQRELP